MGHRALLWVVTIFGFVYLFIPLITIAVFTFNDPTGEFNTSWKRLHVRQLGQPVPERATSPTPSSCRCRSRSSPARSPRSSAALIALALARYRIRGGALLNLLLVLPLTTPEIVMGASLFTLFFNQGVEPRVLDDRHRPHDVLPVVRRAHREGPHPRPRLDARGRRRRPRLAAAADVLEDHVPADPARRRRRVPAVAVAVDRRLHHHVVHRRQTCRRSRGEIFDSAEGRDPAAGARARHADHARGHR